VTTVLNAIRKSDDLRMSLDKAAGNACLSPTRFAHLFRDPTVAQTSSQAIRDVVHAVRYGAPLEKSFDHDRAFSPGYCDTGLSRNDVRALPSNVQARDRCRPQ
jgi:hypothetical protein